MNKIPKTVSHRLSLYQRCLKNLILQGKKNISSKELAEKLGFKSSQVRKDLSYFGAFGKRGVGYDTNYLLKMIERILGVNKSWSVVVIGAGNLGHALINYEILKKNGFYIVGIFDSDPKKIGKKIGEICDLAIITTKDYFSEILKGAVGSGMEKENISYISDPGEIFKTINAIKKQKIILLEGRVPAKLKDYLLKKEYNN